VTPPRRAPHPVLPRRPPPARSGAPAGGQPAGSQASRSGRPPTGPAQGGVARLRQAAWPLVVAVVVAGTLGLAVFPARTYIAQRRGLIATEQRVRVLTQQNRELSSRVEKLNTDAEIERLARQQYNLVRPGEEAYAILPRQAPLAHAPAPDAQAPAQRRHRGGGFWSGLWAHLWPL